MTEAKIVIQIDRGTPSTHRIDKKMTSLDLQLIGLRVIHNEGEGDSVVVETPSNLKGLPKKDFVEGGRKRGFRYSFSSRSVFVQVEHKQIHNSIKALWFPI